MSEFPQDFQEAPRWLEAELDPVSNEALKRLEEKGYRVAIGLNEFYAGVISQLSQQPHIVEYCPADATLTRFASCQTTRRWLAKNSGRAVFLLLESPSQEKPYEELVGYAWTGYGSDAPIDFPLTSAYRLAASACGRGLAKDYIRVVLGATEALFSRERMSLQTWESNPAFQIYQQLGFVALRYGSKELRPSLQASAVGGRVEDRRVTMGYEKKTG